MVVIFRSTNWLPHSTLVKCYLGHDTPSTHCTNSELTCNIHPSQALHFVKVNKREIYVAPDAGTNHSERIR